MKEEFPADSSGQENKSQVIVSGFLAQKSHGN